MRLHYHQIAAAHAVVGGKIGELLHEILFLQIIGERLHLGKLLQILPVLVGVGEGILEHESAHESLLIIRCEIRCILRDEHVGHDAATAIDSAAKDGVISRSRLLDAVLREELSMLVSVQQVGLIIGVVTGLIRFLNAAARRSIVAGYGEPDHTTVGESNLLLYKAFTEGSAPDNSGAVVVLHGSGEYL